ncbi:MAG: hypothetical protein RBT46_00565 [Weeksellaceae bacterium]|jgi:hypothetical protein|nr:hypothetical protein [Weeksellaceae bacterium]
MNSRIQHLLNHPLEVQESDIALLQDEIDKYPYFSTLRTLLLFSLNESHSMDYSEKLKKASIYSPSRVALYHYLQKEKQTTPEIEDQKEEITQEVLISDSDLKTIEIQETIIEEKEPETSESTIQEVKEGKIEEEKTPIDSHSNHTFSEWLSLVSPSVKTVHDPITESKAPTEKDIKYRLIDEFIEKSPKITPVAKYEEPQAGTLKPENNNEYSDLMTETLAQIYTEQKMFDKAIKAYKILSLKYPDKKDFFQNKINEIENKRNS